MTESGDIPGINTDSRPTVDIAVQRNEAFAEWKKRLDGHMSAARARQGRLSARMREAQSRGESQDGIATVTVGAGGRLLSLEFSSSVRGASPERIAASVMAAYRDAAMAVGGQTVEILAETVGPEQAESVRKLILDQHSETEEGN